MERSFLVSPQQLFAAYLDTQKREKWSAPSDKDEVRILNEDVRTGGSESTLCGTKGNMKFKTSVHYHLVETDRIISFSETLLEGDTVLAAALVTFEFIDRGSSASKLKLNAQITSYGPDFSEGYRAGLSQALDNLNAMFVG
jgi:uncharacterized protein YndB with AHSA1/START domain